MVYASGKTATLLIFLTRFTEFGRKLEASRIAEHFRDYTGGNTPQEGIVYILERMGEVSPSASRRGVRPCGPCQFGLPLCGGQPCGATDEY